MISCCSKRATPYRKDYGHGGFESGYRCKRCLKIRLHFPVDGSAYEQNCALLLPTGIAFDQSLETKTTEPQIESHEP